MPDDRVVLVDADDREIDTADKIAAHRDGRLHRAFSVFLEDASGRVLLQRRATEKYHSGGLWSNTCCGHPRPGEGTAQAAGRRLREEMGVEAPLTPVCTFTYRAEFPNGLSEHEIDHVFVGRWDDAPQPDPREVADWRWVAPDELRADLDVNGARYTVWLKPALEGLLAYRRRRA